MVEETRLFLLKFIRRFLKKLEEDQAKMPRL